MHCYKFYSACYTLCCLILKKYLLNFHLQSFQHSSSSLDVVYVYRVGRPMGLLTAGIKCGTSGTVCGGRVLFNKCEVSQSNSALLSMLDAPSAKRGSRRGRGDFVESYVFVSFSIVLIWLMRRETRQVEASIKLGFSTFTSVSRALT